MIWVLALLLAEIRLEGTAFRVDGWSGAVPDGGLTVYVDGSDVPILGASEGLTFKPRYPLEPGLRYRAVFKPASLERVFEIPRAATPVTRVFQVYPTAARLPENLLKFYIHFSGEMTRGEVYQRVRLLDEAGRPIDLPFLELEQELWDSSMRRVTLLFDPGRLKRELKPREEVGSPLREGSRYSLVIDAGWPDANGRPLEREFRKAFEVGPPDPKSPDWRKWRVTAPRRGTREPVEIDFGESLDHALAGRAFEVEGIDGSVEVDREETRWRFTPSEPWAARPHSVRVDKTLTDLAGNSLTRPFEVDVWEKVERQIKRETVRLQFRPR